MNERNISIRESITSILKSRKLTVVVRVNGLLCARIVVVGFNHATNTTIYSINTEDVTDEKAKSVIQIQIMKKKAPIMIFRYWMY